MRAFVSYSLNDSEQYVLTVLAKILREQGFVVSSTYNLSSNVLDYNTLTQLNKSSLFIGLITNSGVDNQRVFKEWKQALTKRVPSLLLVENTVDLNPRVRQNPNVIVFDRYNPEPSIDNVKDKIIRSRQSTSDNTAAWVFGGLAVLALIGLLSDRK